MPETPETPHMPAWPYPFWIAHRGAGRLAPENTLAAFRLGASLGWQMIECDVKLSQDGVPFLMHDASLERTTSGSGSALQAWAQLSQLDAGSWHSRLYAGEPLLTLQNAARWSQANGVLLNLEIKPVPGQEEPTGQTVASSAARLWAHAPIAPLLTSFSVPALRAARRAAPALPLGLLADPLPGRWQDITQELDCMALIVQHRLCTGELAQQAHALGLRLLSYTVNDEAEAHRLIALGADGLISDAVDRFCPAQRAETASRS